MSSSSSSSSDTTKLLVTAMGAALAGAGIAIAALTYGNKMDDERNKKKKNNSGLPTSSGHYDSATGRSNPPFSYIYEDLNRSDPDLQGMAAAHAYATTNTLLFPHNHEEKMRRRIAARAAVEEDNTMPRNSVTVRVPATSANMGPGYDTIGMSVDMWSEVTVERAEEFQITAEGDGADNMPTDDSNYMVVGVKAAFEAANKPMPVLRYHCKSRIPYARGLGSSSAAIVAGIIAGLVLAGHRLPCWGSEALLQIAAGIEGHPDNVAPAIYGGIQIGIHNGTRWVTERVPCPAGLQLVMFIPDFVGKTADARGVLQETVTRSEASFNISRTAFLVHALCSGNLDNLKWGVQDKLHQPARGVALYRYLYPMIEAAENAGAACAYLSGAGPTVMAITAGASGDIFAQREKERSETVVARAMRRCATDHNVRGKLVVTQVAAEGARVVKVDPPFSDEAGITYGDNI